MDKKELSFLNAQKYFKENKCIWYVDTLYNNKQQMCSTPFMFDDENIQYFDVDHNPIDDEYYNKPQYLSNKWKSKEYTTITPSKLENDLFKKESIISTYTLEPSAITKLIADSLNKPVENVTVHFVIEEVGGDPDIFQGTTNQMTKIKVEVKS